MATFITQLRKQHPGLSMQKAFGNNVRISRGSKVALVSVFSNSVEFSSYNGRFGDQELKHRERVRDPEALRTLITEFFGPSPASQIKRLKARNAKIKDLLVKYRDWNASGGGYTGRIDRLRQQLRTNKILLRGLRAK
ncbi:hypothetical protein [Ralstonia phage phiRSL1]|uniref:Uncharacterized protein n=1 Tax=Ralstonia phage phiRSL1 TaxID=1980924 RepID=B2ZXN8_9CAUD|nr:hypothetical protein RSL1_ORF018 [Ralstonia phage phiRSL1]BAG41463.1 hypothetical protein [Ralstonia phage phiRSL1]